MSTKEDSMRMDGWARSLEELDREIGRLALLCRVRILEPSVIDHVLQGDPSVCGTDNAVAFAKLRNLLTMHFTLHGRWAAELGEKQTTAIERYVIERLRKSLPDLVADWPPA
jgi:hypothetical protein